MIAWILSWLAAGNPAVAPTAMVQPITYLTQLCPDISPNASSNAIAQSWACPERQRPLLQRKFRHLLSLSPQSLQLSSQHGQPFVFHHNPAEGEQFSRYEFDGCSADERYCLVRQWGWEWWQHLLLDRATGQTHRFTGTLYLAPDQQHLLELLDSRRSETFDQNIIKLYQLTDQGPLLQLDLSDSVFGGHKPRWLDHQQLRLQLWYYNPASSSELQHLNDLELNLLPAGWKLRMTPYQSGSAPAALQP